MNGFLCAQHSFFTLSLLWQMTKHTSPGLLLGTTNLNTHPCSIIAWGLLLVWGYGFRLWAWYGLVWFGLVRSSLSQQFHFSVCAPLAHLMNVRHGILNFNCCNGIVAAVAAAAVAAILLF